MDANEFPQLKLDAERVALALRRVGALWAARLDSGWEPPAGSAFPWAQVRLSLAALVEGVLGAQVLGPEDVSTSVTAEAGKTVSADAPLSTPNTERPIPLTAALILAGNTPLLSWSPLCACLLAGWHVRVKMSRDETLWPRLFWETLHEADPDIAARVRLDVWPGDDLRTTELVQSADAVVAFGSDQTLARLRALTPDGTPFFGFGHAVSIGVCLRDGLAQAGNFARDILMYNQEGCLSAQAILVEDSGQNREAEAVARALRARLAVEVDALQVPPLTDEATAHRVRSARDLALFASDVQVIATDDLRWTIFLHIKPAPIAFPQGHGIVQVIPFPLGAETLTESLGAVRGSVSSVGIAGTLSPALEHALGQETSISRICPAGEMQTPPLDWPNGNVDLTEELRARSYRVTSRSPAAVPHHAPEAAPPPCAAQETA